MQLTVFIEGLLRSGAVTINNGVLPFEADDEVAALVLLQEYYALGITEMPCRAPAFDAAAGLWAAQYLYRSVQLILLRNLGDEAIGQYLVPFPGTVTAEAVYSTDLCFRHLPSLLLLAKGLAPEDPLVLHLKETARRWPFSSAGMEDVPEAADLSVIFNHASLKQEYTDRIISTRNVKKAQAEPFNGPVQEALGQHSTLLWPDFPLNDLNPK